MRKLLMAAAAILLMMTMMVLTACTSDNDDNPAPEAEILAFYPLLKCSSIADVEQHIQAKQWWSDGNDGLDFWEDPFKCWHKWYWVSAEDALTEQYLFETEDGQNLRYVECVCWDNTVSVELCKNTLHHQGFKATGNIVQFDGDPYEQYFSADNQTEALVNINDEGYWYVIYKPSNM